MKFLIILVFVFSISDLFASVFYSEDEKEYLKSKKTITMCVDPDWEPFEKIENNTHIGIAGDIIRLIAQRGDIDIKLIPTKSWEESIEFSKNHTCDIMSFLNQTPKREEWLTFTDVIFSDPNVLIGRNERSYIEDISKEKLSIALPRDTAMAERFAKDFPNLTIIPTTTEAEAFQLVENRKADITLRSMIVTAFTIKNENLFNLKIIGEPKGYENYLRIGVRKDEPILRDILNHSIATLTQNDIDKIVNQHVSIVIKKSATYTVAFQILFALVIVIVGVLLWNRILNKRVKEAIEKNREQQELYMQQTKKAEIGELIGNISHQWKNGLTQIASLNLEMILMHQMKIDLNTKEFNDKLLETENSIKFMVETMDSFLNFYKGTKEIRSFGVKENIQNLIRLMEIKIRNTKTLITIDEKEPHTLEANPNEWMHIWLNLISNSLKAAEQKEISIPTIDIQIEKDSIIYSDNCGGIDSEILALIKSNKQIGLGIKMVHEITKKYQWDFRIFNSDLGSKFIFTKKSIS